MVLPEEGLNFLKRKKIENGTNYLKENLNFYEAKIYSH
jgi:hypothetical protein